MAESTQSTTRLLTRFKCLLEAVFYAFASLTVLMYGLVFTVNLLTQLHFASDWFYLLTACCCYTVLAGLIYVLLSRLRHAFKQAVSSG